MSNQNQNQNQIQNQNANQNQIVSNEEIWQENLRRNEEQRRKQNKWFNMQPGEKATLEFLPDFGPVFKDFDGDGKAETLRYEYKVVDVNHPEEGVKPWDVSKSWSETIDYLLSQGHRILKVERVGSGMKTRYYFSSAGHTAT
ncbi:MAG TPA: hypothetical protein VJ729_16555 [Nitrososphaeraceae archaeon]|nr:hypothetical protein [Nitrososphaeraceae archaeon]